PPRPGPGGAGGSAGSASAAGRGGAQKPPLHSPRSALPDTASSAELFSVASGSGEGAGRGAATGGSSSGWRFSASSVTASAPGSGPGAGPGPWRRQNLIERLLREDRVRWSRQGACAEPTPHALAQQS